ncbi:MAG: DUF2847 family protein [Chloroflexi bacterium]|nr:DUF2847 family protein [Chloroflexota bacterium]
MASDPTVFRQLTTSAEIDQLLERSMEEPVLLFQHDPYCPISSRAYREVMLVGGTFALVDVSEPGDVKRTIEARTGVKHESPQVILLRGGRAVWSASHYAVTAEAIAQAAQQSA